MRNRVMLLALAGTAGLAMSAQGQVNLYLVRTENLASICVNRYTSADNLTNGSRYFIGTNPFSVEYDGTNLYVGGYDNSGNLDPFSSSAGIPMARQPDAANTPNTFGLTNNPLTGRPLVAGQALTEVYDAADTLSFPAGYWQTQIVKIELTPTGRNFISSVATRDTFSATSLVDPVFNPDGTLLCAPGIFRGVSGMDYDPRAGLLASYDCSNYAPGKIRWFDVNTQQTAILLAPTAANFTQASGRQGIAGPAWDFGPTGAGFTYTNALGTFTGPLVAFMAVFAGGPAPYGPIGIDPHQMDYTADFSGGFTNNPPPTNNIYNAGNPEATLPPIPPFNNGPIITGAAGNTVYRDISINPINGNLAARANNDLLIAYREANGTTLGPRRYRLPASQLVSSVGQRCKILAGFPGGDLVVWNDRGSAVGGNIFATVKFNKMDGVLPPAAVTVNYMNPDNTPATFAASPTKVWDFAWHQPTNTLVMMDFDSRNVYFFTTTPPSAACNVADVCGIGGPPSQPDGLLTGDDFNAFINAFAASDPLADICGIGGPPSPPDGLITGDDFNAFINAFATGCP